MLDSRIDTMYQFTGQRILQKQSMFPSFNSAMTGVQVIECHLEGHSQGLILKSL